MSRLCPGTNRLFSGPFRSVPGRFFPSGVQVPLEVAQGMYPLLDHEERMGVHLPDLLPPRRPGGLNTINGLPGRKSSGEPARLLEMPLPGIPRKLTQKPSFSACDGVCFMVYCKNAEQVSETVKRLRDLPSSERKIVTKETHQGCLSFAIIGFWDFLSSKNRTQNEKIVFFIL